MKYSLRDLVYVLFEGLNEVSPERFNASPEGLVVSSSRKHITMPEGLRFPKIYKLSA